jgi:hypothetical protein
MRTTYQKFKSWWYGGNARFDEVTDAVLAQYDDAFVFGGYVRGQVDPEKQISDVDVAVRNADFESAENFLRTMGCKQVYQDDPPSWLRRWDGPVFFEGWITIGNYSRFMCPKGVKVDLLDHRAFDETIDTMPSDVHFLVKTREGLESYNEARFPTDELLESMKAKVYRALLDGGRGCEKLEKEGYRSQ